MRRRGRGGGRRRREENCAIYYCVSLQDKSADYSAGTSVGQKNRLRAKLVMGTYEVLILILLRVWSNVFCNCSPSRVQRGPQSLSGCNVPPFAGIDGVHFHCRRL